MDDHNRTHEELRQGEMFLKNATIAEFNNSKFKSKRRGNLAYTADGKMIPRAEVLDQTVYPIFISRQEAG